MHTHHDKDSFYSEQENWVKTKHAIKEEIKKLCESDKQSWNKVEQLTMLLKLCEKLKEYGEDRGFVYHDYDHHMHHGEHKMSSHPTSKYERVYDEVDEIIHGEPATWKAYAGKPGAHMDILNMEIAEMQNAYTHMRTTPPTGTHKQFTHELLHVAAAAIYAYEAMTCAESKE